MLSPMQFDYAPLAPGSRRTLRAVELGLVWFAVPAALAWMPLRVHPLLALWVASSIGLAALLLDPTFDRRSLVDLRGFRAGVLGALGRSAAVFAALTVAAILVPSAPTSFTLPDGERVLLDVPVRLFALPREQPGLWLTVTALYPILSVAPQTLLYRTLLVHRYGLLFARRSTLVLTGALAFGLAHLLFRNAVAPSLTFIGGIVLMATFLRHRSNVLSWLEHALYGISVFTVGLGRWFYGGAVV